MKLYKAYGTLLVYTGLLAATVFDCIVLSRAVEMGYDELSAIASAGLLLLIYGWLRLLDL